MGIIDTKISEKDAITLYSSVLYTPSAQYGWITTVDLWPITGRKHQLRRHLQSIGHFIVGDRRHSHSLDWPSEFTPMLLWALEVKFPHPQYHLDGSLERNGVKLNDNTHTDGDAYRRGLIDPGNKFDSFEDTVCNTSIATTGIRARRKERFSDPPMELLSRLLSTQTDGHETISSASLDAIQLYYQHTSRTVSDRCIVVVEIDEPDSYEQYRQAESSGLLDLHPSTSSDDYDYR